jgi:hypothetical protein
LSVLQRPHIVAITTATFRDGLPKMLAKAQLVMIAERIAVCRDTKGDTSWLSMGMPT